MAVFQKEWRQGYKGFLIWAVSIACMMVICVCMFPQMKGQMNEVSDMFANMGSFTKAFGMDQLNFGDFLGFYGVECGNVLGIGGGFFAAYLGIAMLSKEEKEHTAEFLLSHPVSRANVFAQKLLALISQVVAMNVLIIICSYASVWAIHEEIDEEIFLLMHLAYLILQIEIALICFGVSAFLHSSSIGIGIGLATIFYFMNIICNISEKVEFLKYITPFAYTEGGDILADHKLNECLVVLGLVYAVIFVIAGFLKYTKKDMAA
ncbi:MAG: ABC transporter permease subunit [Lachnospiraceae bacterium]